MFETRREEGTNGAWPSDGRRVRVALLLLVGLALLAYAYQCRLFWHYTNDDAFITFRYSRFLALGRGPYFNPGEHVEGYTNPLFMFAMAPVIALAGPEAAPSAAKGIGLVCGGLALVAGFLLVRRLALTGGSSDGAASLLGIASVGLVAVDPSFALNAVRGLETLVYSAFLTLGVVLGIEELLERRFRGSGLAFAAAALTRPEGAFLFAVFWGAALLATVVAARREEASSLPARERFGPLVANALVVVAAVAALLAFRLIAYDGEWLPNTYYAKLGGASVGPFWYVGRALWATVFSWLGVAVAAIGLAVSRVPLAARLPLAATSAAGLALPFLVGTDWMLGFRLVAPYLPFVAAAAVIGWHALAVRIGSRRLAPLALALLAPLAWALETGERTDLLRRTEVRARSLQTGHRALGRWLAATAEPGEAVALMDIGMVGYQAIDQTIIDLTGLTNRKIAKSRGGFLAKEYDVALVLDREPRFVVLVLTSRGRPYEPPPSTSRFRFWTEIERSFYEDPRFQAGYVDRRPVSEEAPWLERLASRWGAKRIFPAGGVDRHYLLALFERRSRAAEEAAARRAPDQG